MFRALALAAALALGGCVTNTTGNPAHDYWLGAATAGYVANPMGSSRGATCFDHGSIIQCW